MSARQTEDDMVEEETMAGDYQAQMHYNNNPEDDMDGGSYGGAQDIDVQAMLQAAVTPLEYPATLEAKFASYDNYCSLFHYVLNSEGPVELELPNVSQVNRASLRNIADSDQVLLGVGRHR